MKKSSFLYLQFCSFLISFSLIDNCIAQCIYINPNLPATSPCDSKTGYNLIFSDECNGFNSNYWDKSSPGDDLPGYDSDSLCHHTVGVENAPMNEVNVDAGGGTYNLRVRVGEEQNACSHSGAEIKTFSIDPSPVREWKVYKDSYIEARYLMPSCDGIGANFWLYGLVDDGFGNKKFYEVDINEQNPNKPDMVNSNIHFGPSYANQTTYPIKTKFCNLAGNSVSLEGKYLTFGVEINDQGINFYLNDVFFRNHPFSNTSPYNVSNFPFNIRLGVGSTTVGGSDASDCEDLPQYLNIDYVRVYEKSGKRAVTFWDHKSGILTLCANNHCPQEYCNFLSVNYFPGATYQWQSSPFFNIENVSYDGGNREIFRFNVNPGTPAGTYLQNLVVNFPCGYVENLPLTVIVINAVPPTPTSIALYSDDGVFFYPGVSIGPGSDSYDWGRNGIANWNQPNPRPGTKNIWELPFKAGNNPRQVQICVRARNVCGTSPMYCQTVIIPAIDHDGVCLGCRVELLPPRKIFVDYDQTSMEFQLKVKANPLSKSYKWSFDQENWHETSNIEGQDFNYFGPITSTPDSFTVYVQAKNLDTLSGIYSERIALYLPKDTENKSSADSPLNRLIFQDSSQVREHEAPIEEQKPIKYIFYNCLGQAIQEGRCDDLSQPILEERFSGGLYVLLKLNKNNTITSVSKLMIVKQ